MKTRAAVAFLPKSRLEVVELEFEGPRAGEVLVEIMARGICRSDAHTRYGFDRSSVFPLVLGPEDINRGFDLMHEGKSIRSVVVF